MFFDAMLRFTFLASLSLANKMVILPKGVNYCNICTKKVNSGMVSVPDDEKCWIGLRQLDLDL